MDNSVTENAAPCALCKNHIAGTFNCKAFPKGIPDEILFGDNDHTEPFTGDHGIQFEPRDDEEEEEEVNKWSREFEIIGKQEEQQIVYGWLSVAYKADGTQVVDADNDIIEVDDLEKAAIDFSLNSRKAGENHERIDGIGRMVASIVTSKEIQKAMGIPDGYVPQGWFIGFRIDDPDVWDKVKKGIYSGFSVGGRGRREVVEE